MLEVSVKSRHRVRDKIKLYNTVFLAPTGALEEGILSVRPSIHPSVCPHFP